VGFDEYYHTISSAKVKQISKNFFVLIKKFVFTLKKVGTQNFSFVHLLFLAKSFRMWYT